MTAIKVHRCRFVHYIPSPVLQISSFDQKFAVLRENGQLEIYSLHPQIHLINTLFTSNTEQIVLLKSTVITASLDGQVKMYCLSTGKVLQTHYSSGGAIWSLIINPDQTLLAIGTESGQIHLLSPSLEYLSTFNLQTATRITSLAFHPTKPVIACGSVDGKVRIIHLDTHKVIQTLVLTRQNTIIWSLVFTPDGTLVTGDSVGKVLFWNCKNGTMIKGFSHQADVLAMTCMGDKVISTGVDRQIQTYEFDKTWIQSNKRKYHSHDVRSLTTISNSLISGGIDQIIASDTNSNKLCRFGLVPQYSVLSFGKKLVAARFDDGIRIYRLDDGYKHLVTVTLSNPKFHVLSSDGTVLLVYSDGLKMFKIDYEEMNVVQIKNDVFDVEDVYSLCLDAVAVLGMVGQIAVLDLETFSMKLVNLNTKFMVTRLAISNGVVVCGDVGGNLVSVNLSTLELGLPMPKYRLSSMQFIPSTTDLVITTISNEIYILKVTTNRLHPWSEKNSSNIPSRLLNRKEIIKGVTFSSKGMLIYGSNFVYHIDLSKDIDSPWNLDSRYQSIMDVNIQDGEMIVVERPVLQVLSEIGGAVETKKYGE